MSYKLSARGLSPPISRVTIADHVHIIAMGFIFASVVQSAFCLKWDEAGPEAKWKKVDAWSLVIFPLFFLLCTTWLIMRAFW